MDHASPKSGGGPDSLGGEAGDAQRTLLITLTGLDRPGVTSRLFGALSSYPLEIVDVEQVVIRGRLVLGALVAYDDAAAVLPDVSRTVHRVGCDLGLEVELATGIGNGGPDRRGRVHVTVLGSPLLPAAMAGVAGRIAACGANIDRIVRLAHYPVTCIELEVSGGRPDTLRAELATEAAAREVDVAVQRSGLHRRAKRLVVMDVDSTLVQGEVLELLATRAGRADEVARITEQAMNGELDFETALRERVAILKGLDVSVLAEVRDQLRLAPGARTLVRTLKRLDYRFAIVSGGFSQITDALVERLGIDYSAANTLEVVDGTLTGQLTGPVLDRAGKAAALRRFAHEAGVPLTQTVAIGDGANDLDMIATAGLGVAFNAKPVVREVADTAVNVPYLDAIVFLLGISREEVEAADAADG